MASRARSYGCRQSIQANTRRSVHKGGGGCRLPSALLPCGPGVLIHTQEFQFQKNQKTHLSVPCSVAIIRLPALELTNKLLDGTLKKFAPTMFRIQRDHILSHLRW